MKKQQVVLEATDRTNLRHGETCRVVMVTPHNTYKTCRRCGRKLNTERETIACHLLEN